MLRCGIGGPPEILLPCLLSFPCDLLTVFQVATILVAMSSRKKVATKIITKVTNFASVLSVK